MSASQSAGIRPLVSRNAAQDAIADALKLYVGRGRRYSVKQLSNATGIKDRVIECAMTSGESADCRPVPPEALLSFAMFLGAEFTSEVLRIARQGAFDLPDEDTPPGRMAADAAEDTACLAGMAAGSTPDPHMLRIVGVRMATRGAQIMRLAA